MKSFILLSFLFVNVVLCAQKNESKDKFQLFLKTSLLPLIDVVGGSSVRISSEFKIHKNISFSAEAGKFFRYDAFQNGNVLSFELKYYINKSNCMGYFIGIEYLQKKTNFEFTDSIAIPSQLRVKKRYEIHKEISYVTAKWGKLNIYSNKYIFEWYIGFGVRYQYNSYNNLSIDENQYLLTGEGHGGILSSGIRNIDTYFSPNINAGLKIGFNFFGFLKK